MNNDRNRLYDFVLARYPTEESVRELCFRLFVNYDDLPARAQMCIRDSASAVSPWIIRVTSRASRRCASRRSGCAMTRFSSSAISTAFSQVNCFRNVPTSASSVLNQYW